MTETDDRAATRATPTKPALRRQVLARRDAVSAATRAAAAQALARLADLVAVAPGGIVAGYLPIRSEIDPRPLMAELERRGARLALPAVLADGETMEFRPWRTGGPLEPASFGLEVPPAGSAPVEPDVLLLPLAAFDETGLRIGWGKGHYDRALARLEARKRRTGIGLAFALQRVERIPGEPHDRRLDLILTEDGPVWPRLGEDAPGRAEDEAACG